MMAAPRSGRSPSPGSSWRGPSSSWYGSRGGRPCDDRAVLFELRNVHYVRGGREILRGLSTELPEGSSCIAGPSGCGKSTLLRLLNRLADPRSGEVRYRGVDVRELDPLPLRREACLVPQLPALLEGYVADNVRYGADLAGRECDVERALELAGLDSG